MPADLDAVTMTDSVVATAQLKAETDLRRALNRCGIGQRYSRTRLHDFGQVGKDLAKQLTATGEEAIQLYVDTGEGLIIEGQPVQGTDLLCCYLKGLLCSNIDVYYLTPDRLLTTLSEPPDAFINARVLGLGRMFDKSYAESPFAPYDRYRIENYLMAQLDDDVPLIVSGYGDLKSSNWWSPEFIDLLVQCSRQTVVV